MTTALGVPAGQALSVPATSQHETPESAWGACQDTGRVTAERKLGASTRGRCRGNRVGGEDQFLLSRRPCGPPSLA